MKKLAVILLLLLPSFGFAQFDKMTNRRNLLQNKSIDKSVLQVDYSVERMIDTVKRVRCKDRTVLDIGQNITHYYSLFALQGDSLRLQAILQNKQAYDPHFLKKEERAFCEDYLFNYPSKGRLTVSSFFVNIEYTYEEPIPELTYDTSSDESQTILGYICQKATTSFRGRTWTVWYAPEIPMPYGPWKLHGLPGLILMAEDAERYFTIKAMGIASPKDKNIYIVSPDIKINTDPMTFKKTTRANVAKLQRMSWQDPVGLIISHGTQVKFMSKSGNLTEANAGSVTNPYIPPYELK